MEEEEDEEEEALAGSEEICFFFSGDFSLGLITAQCAHACTRMHTRTRGLHAAASSCLYIRLFQKHRAVCKTLFGSKLKSWFGEKELWRRKVWKYHKKKKKLGTHKNKPVKSFFSQPPLYTKYFTMFHEPSVKFRTCRMTEGFQGREQARTNYAELNQKTDETLLRRNRAWKVRRTADH